MCVCVSALSSKSCQGKGLSLSDGDGQPRRCVVIEREKCKIMCELSLSDALFICWVNFTAHFSENAK